MSILANYSTQKSDVEQNIPLYEMSHIEQLQNRILSEKYRFGFINNLVVSSCMVLRKK